MRYRLETQDQNPVAFGGNGETPADLAVYLNRSVRAGRKTLPAPNARLIDDMKLQRLVPSDRNRIGRTNPDTGQTRDAGFRVDDEIHEVRNRRRLGDADNLTAQLRTVKR